MKKLSIKHPTLYSLVLTLLFTAIITYIGYSLSWESLSFPIRLSNGLSVAGVVILCAGTFRFFILYKSSGGDYFYEYQVQSKREMEVKKSQPGQDFVPTDKSTSNMYKYKLGPQSTVGIIGPGVGILCIILSLLLGLV